MNPFSRLKLMSSPKTSRPSSQPPMSAPPTKASASDLNAPPATTAASGKAPVPHISKLEVAGQTGYPSSRPGLARALWAAHPNRTTRKLRKLLVSWEELGFFLSFSGTPPQLSPAAEQTFLRVKVAVAKSVSFLKSIHGVGDIGREAGFKEKDFIEILELYPSLCAALTVSTDEKRELFRAWHSLYLFLHRVLGADPHEVSAESVFFPADSHAEIHGARRNVRPFREGKTA